MKTFTEYMNLSSKQMKYYYDYLPSNAINHFEKRTREHIERVKYCSELLCSIDYNLKYLNKQWFLNCVDRHDNSKFYSDIYPGYVWINAHYNLNVEYPNKEVKQLSESCWIKHYKQEEHHPEHWVNCNHMNDFSIMEMVCDWCSMSMEYNSSLSNWVNTKAFKKYNFNKENKDKILHIVGVFNEYNIDDMEKEFKNKIKE